jgi:uncharacterized protein (DUF4415 family)
MKKVPSKSVSKKVKAELAALAALPDDQIDTHDIPEIMDWSGAQRGRFYRPIKKQLTLRIDGDVLDWFKRCVPRGRGYQTQINNALRHYVRVVEYGASLRLKGWHAGFSKAALNNFMREGGLSVAEATRITSAVVRGQAVTVLLPKLRDPLVGAEQLGAIGIEEIDIVLRTGHREAVAEQ